VWKEGGKVVDREKEAVEKYRGVTGWCPPRTKGRKRVGPGRVGGAVTGGVSEQMDGG